jgi:hypothetical protein
MLRLLAGSNGPAMSRKLDDAIFPLANFRHRRVTVPPLVLAQGQPRSAQAPGYSLKLRNGRVVAADCAGTRLEAAGGYVRIDRM